MDIRNYFSSKKKEGAAAATAGVSGGKEKSKGGDSQKISNPFNSSKNLDRSTTRMDAAGKE